jgi:hypothetical protein
MSSADFDPYHKWLGIPPSEQPPNHYRLLGIAPFENDPEVIDRAANARILLLRTFQNTQHVQLSQRLLSQVTIARANLLDQPFKAQYDAELMAKAAPLPPIPPPTSPTPIEQNPPGTFIATGAAPPVRRSRASDGNNPLFLAMTGAGGILGIGLGCFIVVKLVGLDALGLAPNAPPAHLQKAPPAVEPEAPRLSQPNPAPAPVAARPSPSVAPPAQPPSPSPSVALPTPPQSSSPAPPAPPSPSNPPAAPQPMPVSVQKLVVYGKDGKRTLVTESTTDLHTVEEWVELAQKNNPEPQRKAASNALLAITAQHKAKSQLLNDDERAAIRKDARKMLALRTKDADPIRVLQILGPVADAECAESIRRFAATDVRDGNKAQLRLTALHALSEIVDNTCVADLVRVVEGDINAPNRLEAINLLGKVKARPELKRLSGLRTLPDQIRQAAVAALDKIPSQ